MIRRRVRYHVTETVIDPACPSAFSHVLHRQVLTVHMTGQLQLRLRSVNYNLLYTLVGNKTFTVQAVFT